MTINNKNSHFLHLVEMLKIPYPQTGRVCNQFYFMESTLFGFRMGAPFFLLIRPFPIMV
jgi:hypothetical protein